MGFKETLSSDLVRALKAKENIQLSVLRFLLAQIHNREIEKRSQRGTPDLTEEEIVEVLRREMKKRKEAIELFRKGGRNDVALKEESEVAVIQHYLPKEISREEIGAVIKKLIAAGFKDFQSLIRESMKTLKGKADGRTVGEIIKETLKSNGS